MKGTIRKYITCRGYGFIKGENLVDYFFHITDTNLDPRFRYELDGVEVEFDPKEIHDGLMIKTNAEKVRINQKIDHINDEKGETENE